MTSKDDNGEAREPGKGRDDTLNSALENTLANLNSSIARMEEIVSRFEAGDAELDESIRMLSEANELAVASSKELDQAVQKVVYHADEDSGNEGDSDTEGEATRDS